MAAGSDEGLAVLLLGPSVALHPEGGRTFVAGVIERRRGPFHRLF